MRSLAVDLACDLREGEDMDGRQFDLWTRALGHERSRRRFAKMFVAGALGALGAKSAPRVTAQAVCTPSKEACETTGQCCRGACVNSICDSTCSEVDSLCETDLDCCSSLACKTLAGGTPRCRPDNCVAQAGACVIDGDCCEGFCLGNVCALSHATETPIEQPTGGPTAEPTKSSDATPVPEPTQASDSGSGDGTQAPGPEMTLPKTGVASSQPDRSTSFGRLR